MLLFGLLRGQKVEEVKMCWVSRLEGELRRCKRHFVEEKRLHYYLVNEMAANDYRTWFVYIYH